ncbi:MAG TPA: hypothetical protein VNM22_09280 [Candidatus Limnocylindrales bacterium]|nr:hypothetical protein [Candidatus Limnocylindrales bacterium]
MTRKTHGKVRQINGESMVRKIPMPVAEVIAGSKYEVERLFRGNGIYPHPYGN